VPDSAKKEQKKSVAHTAHALRGAGGQVAVPPAAGEGSPADSFGESSRASQADAARSAKATARDLADDEEAWQRTDVVDRGDGQLKRELLRLGVVLSAGDPAQSGAALRELVLDTRRQNGWTKKRILAERMHAMRKAS